MLYHFKIDLSDVDRNIYKNLDFRVAQHPSENATYLLTRTLAYVLSYQEGLEFSAAGLGDPESPALKATGIHNAIDLWIEIGNPSARKLHKASKMAKQVRVYTYKKPDDLVKEILANDVHKKDEIEIYAFAPKFLDSLEQQLNKNNKWSVLHQSGQLDIDTGSQQLCAEVLKVSLSNGLRTK